MIQISMRENALWAHGHSGYGPKGQDVICAAVSMLVEATAAALERQDKLALSHFGGGYCFLIATEESPLLEVAWEGFLQLAKHYGDYVKVKDLRRRRMEHA